MATILVLLVVAVLSMAFLLTSGLQGLDDLEDAEDPWVTAPAVRPARRIQTRYSVGSAPRGRHGDRRYHDVDCPVHRRRTDGTGGEI